MGSGFGNRNTELNPDIGPDIKFREMLLIRYLRYKLHCDTEHEM